MKFYTISLLLASLLIVGCVNSTPAQDNSSSNLSNLLGEGLMTKANSTTVVQSGDEIAVDYVGTLDNGTVFDTSIKEIGEKAGLKRGSYELLAFTAGAGQMIKGFDDAVIGMKEGEEKNIKLPPSQAYGEKSDMKILEIPLTSIQTDNQTVQVGDTIMSMAGPGVITAIKGGNATVDFNPPLAGQTLNFRIIMRKITKAK